MTLLFFLSNNLYYTLIAILTMFDKFFFALFQREVSKAGEVEMEDKHGAVQFRLPGTTLVNNSTPLLLLRN